MRIPKPQLKVELVPKEFFSCSFRINDTPVSKKGLNQIVAFLGGVDWEVGVDWENEVREIIKQRVNKVSFIIIICRILKW